eukprot:g39144.t1
MVDTSLLHIHSIQVSQYSVSFNQISHILLNSKYRSRVRNCSSYDKPFITSIILVNILRIPSNASTSFFRYGTQNFSEYSKCSLIRPLYSLS